MTDFSVWLEKRFFSLTILAALLFAGSLVSWWKIPLEVTPSDQVPAFLYLRVATPEEQNPTQTEAIATILVEGAVRTLPGLKSFSSRTSSKVVSVSMQLKPDTPLDLATLQLQEALQPLVDAKIIDSRSISVSRMNPDSTPVVRLGITDKLGILDLQSIIQRELKPRIEAIGSVSKADIQGSEPELLSLPMTLGQVLSRGIEPDKLVPQLRTVHERTSVGQLPIAGGSKTEGIRSILEVSDLETYRLQKLSAVNGLRGTRMADLGEIRPVAQSEATTNRVQGREAVFIDIFLRDRADPFAMEKELRKTVDTVLKLPEARGGIQIDWVMNRVDELGAALSDVQSSLLQSVAVTFLVIFAFIRNWRRTALISATIPLTLLLTIGLLQLAGFTLNIMTLSGLILGIGMVVDNVILVVDRTLEIRREGVLLSTAVSRAVALSMPALLMATITNAIIFLPVVFSTSDDGFVTLLKAFQAPILATLLASLVLTAFLVPVLVRAFPASVQFETEKTHDLQATRRRFTKVYSVRKWAALLALVGVIFLAERVGEIPQTDLDPPPDPWIQLTQRFFEEVPASERRAIFDEFEKDLLSAREEMGYRALASSYSAGAGTASFQFFPKLTENPDSEMTRLEAAIRQWMLRRRETHLKEVGVRYAVANDGGLYDSAIEPRRTLEFQGPRTSVLDATLAKLQEKMTHVDGVAKTLNEDSGFGMKELLFTPDETVLARLGISIQELALKVSSSMHESVVGPLRWNGREIGVRISIHPEGSARTGAPLEWTRDALLAIPITTKSGERLSLRALGWLNERSTRTSISRDQGVARSRIAVEFVEPLSSARSGRAWSKIRSLVSEQEFPPGYGPKASSSTENIDAMQKNMLFMIVLSSLLIYLTLGASFESFFLPWIVLATIPFAVLSGIFGLWVLGRDLDVMARLSLVILVGIGVNNAIILVDLIQELRREGFSIADAVVEGCTRRLEAVFMTTSIQVVGVLPVAFGNSKLMGIPYSSLGVSIISGMILSTVMTLAVLPALYEWAAKIETRFKTRSSTESPGGQPSTAPTPPHQAAS